MRFASTIAIAFTVFALACVSGPGTTPGSGGSGPSEPILEPAARAVADLVVERFAVDRSLRRDSIDLDSVEDVNWSSGAIGCPEPGKFYTQAIVPGYRITVGAPGVTATYNTDGDGTRIVTCDAAD